jgi:haloalkane dehalogenase
MIETMATATNWIDRTMYPFAPHYLDVDGGRMHYVDEGQGQPVLMLHGTPTWSFLYRHLIRGLAPNYRCIVPDHIGFGLSDKPEGWAHRPADHAQNLRALVEHLKLQDIVLVAHDFGGPIGLSYAIEQPQNMRGLVLMNTWLWSMTNRITAVWGSRVLRSPLSRWLNRRTNFHPRVMIPAVTSDRAMLTPTVKQHYQQPFAHPQDRSAPMDFARELIAASDWYEQQWQQRAQLHDIPTLLLWGMRDPTMPPSFLECWQAAFPAAEVVRFPHTGHLVPEEQGDTLVPHVRTWLERKTQEVLEQERR